MGRCLFTNKNYNIYRVGQGYIVHDVNKPFKEAHTHCNNYNLCKIMIYCCLKGCFPSDCNRLKNNKRFVESLTRIASNKYKHVFEDMLSDITDAHNNEHYH